jgi:hypothetical protein
MFPPEQRVAERRARRPLSSPVAMFSGVNAKGRTTATLSDRKTILLLAASDMEQVIEACRAIEREHLSRAPNGQLIDALETAVAVCYWRPFSKRNTMGWLETDDALDPELHAFLKNLRNKVYAHTDKASGRTADVRQHVTESGVEGLVFGESWWAALEDLLPRIIDVATRQRDAYRAESIRLMSD